MKKVNLTLAVIILVISTSANAILVSRLGGLAYYDVEADLTWLADMQYAYTSGYSTDNANGTTFSSSTHILADGRMGRDAALIWANQLNINGTTGWRLPETLQPDSTCGALYINGPPGFNCIGSELGNMYYNVLGGEANTILSVVHNSNYDLFSNLSNTFLWSATDTLNNDITWVFNNGVGYQTTKIKSFSFYAWAVHSGDVATVPEPSTAILILTGLISLVTLSKRNRKFTHYTSGT